MSGREPWVDDAASRHQVPKDGSWSSLARATNCILFSASADISLSLETTDGRIEDMHFGGESTAPPSMSTDALASLVCGEAGGEVPTVNLLRCSVLVCRASRDDTIKRRAVIRRHHKSG